MGLRACRRSWGFHCPVPVGLRARSDRSLMEGRTARAPGMINRCHQTGPRHTGPPRPAQVRGPFLMGLPDVMDGRRFCTSRLASSNEGSSNGPPPGGPGMIAVAAQKAANRTQSHQTRAADDLRPGSMAQVVRGPVLMGLRACRRHGRTGVLPATCTSRSSWPVTTRRPTF